MGMCLKELQDSERLLRLEQKKRVWRNWGWDYGLENAINATLDSKVRDRIKNGIESDEELDADELELLLQLDSDLSGDLVDVDEVHESLRERRRMRAALNAGGELSF